MNKNNVLLLKIVFALLAFAAGTGCLDRMIEPAKPDEKESRAQQQVLRVLYSNHEAGPEAVIDAMETYSRQTGIRIEVEALPYNNLQEKVFSELAQGKGTYDLIAVDTPWMPKVIEHLEPLSSYIKQSNHPDSIKLDDFIAKVFLDTSVFRLDSPQAEPPSLETVSLDGITSAGFEIWSLPIQSNALTVSYRKDLFESPQYREEFRRLYGRELEIPRTFDEYAQLAKFFTRDTDGDGKTDLYGTTLMGSRHEANFVDFKSFLNSFGGRLFDDDFEPAFQSKEGVEALQTYGSWINEYKITPPDVLTYTWDEVSVVFEFGKAAMGMNYHNMRLNPKVGGEVGYFMFPGTMESGALIRGPHFGSWGLAINRYSRQKEDAYALAEYLTSPQSQMGYLKFNHHVTRKSAYEQAQHITDPSLREYYRVLGDSLRVGVGRPRITNYEQVSDAVQSAVHEYLTGEKTAQDALSDAAAEVRGLMRQAGYHKS
ncbi:sugar ABC transporter substrate-binding protein [Paenibacillus phoenicis]|uniref:Sugar ABC transporter substrate-binding protein n=1 Tax=Paenibacillus phoenicis TaxID=554117 RepID=A0ABU5PM47_9BACL|nr:sugar ABC transporter substrate-binding protein [Paenibacillus phoenicis]MEA3571021.1 sugar ABC transporter substrate-binding protein [Paenibacillus phoenicis]